MEWYLNGGVICISKVISDQYFFSPYKCWLFFCFWKNTCSGPVPFVIGLWVSAAPAASPSLFLCSCHLIYFCLTFSNIWFADFLSHSLHRLYILLIMSFAVQNILYLPQQCLFILSLVFGLLVCQSENPCQKQVKDPLHSFLLGVDLSLSL